MSIRRIVDESVEKMFVEVVREYGLDSGDIAPEMQVKLDKATDEITDIVNDFVFLNVKE